MEIESPFRRIRRGAIVVCGRVFLGKEKQLSPEEQTLLDFTLEQISEEQRRAFRNQLHEDGT